MKIEPRHYNPPTDENEQFAELAKCRMSTLSFIAAFCWVFNATDEAWIPFDLWPAQQWALTQIMAHRLTVILKARQLGFTWLLLAYALWQMLFRPAATIGLFSRTETDAGDLLDFRLKGMYERLPAFLQADSIVTNNVSRWELSNGSVAMAFPTTGGRQYTFSFLLADEADFQENLASLMRAVKPTVDAGGAMVLLSTSDKGNPDSPFKGVYRAAVAKANEWFALFLPWHARPGRTKAWYEAQKRDTEANTGSLDDLHQEYPASDVEALAPRSLDKRIPSIWITNCYVKMDGFLPDNAPSIPGLLIFREPEKGKRYVIGVDPAEGNPTSDDSALTVMERMTGEECAALAGKFQPQIIADHAYAIGQYFNNADVLVERNNHGHAVILRLMYQTILRILAGLDDRLGWLSSTLGKTVLYDELADAFRQKQTTLHSFATHTQIASIEGSTLRAPTGTHDDRADGYALANVARALSVAADAAEQEGNGVMVHDENLQISPY